MYIRLSLHVSHIQNSSAFSNYMIFLYINTHLTEIYSNSNISKYIYNIHKQNPASVVYQFMVIDMYQNFI
jgi:hypothetical protein